MAIIPVLDTEKMSAGGSPSGRGSRLPTRVEKSSAGLRSPPTPTIEYTTVWPSGANRARQSPPCWNVTF